MSDLIELRGKRVILSEMVRADVDEMALWPRFREPELQWANLDLARPADRDVYFQHGRSNANRRRFAVRTHSNRLIGTVGLRNIDFDLGDATLGIIIRADEVDRGYGTEVIGAVLGFAFGTLSLKRVLLDVAEDNHRARRVYQKLGFCPIGQHIGPLAVNYIDMVIDRDQFNGDRSMVGR